MTDIVERLKELANDSSRALEVHTATTIREAADLLARLPVDATGRRHVVGDIVYWPDDSGDVSAMCVADRMFARPAYRPGRSVEVDKCYPTPEAAKAAKEAT